MEKTDVLLDKPNPVSFYVRIKLVLCFMLIRENTNYNFNKWIMANIVKWD